MVNDLGPKNMKLWKSLGITTENSSFTNPAASDRHVYVFGDAPHLVKLIRNNLLDHGFVIQEGSIVDGSGVRELVKRSVRDLKVTHRLSDKHIEVTRSSRMKVKLAVQTTGKALQFFGKRGLLECKNWKDTSELILLVASWFDLFNSRVLYDTKASRNTSTADEQQINILNEMVSMLKNLKVCGQKQTYQFQKGLFISCKSLPG